MRLDKFLCDSGLFSRREAAAAAKKGRITVNGAVLRDASRHIREGEDTILLDGKELAFSRFDYLWLHKPAGYVSATEDGKLPCVTDLLPPPYDRRGLFPCGRLDRDTTGLLLLTNDGQLSHRLLSPRHHVEKIYCFTCTPPLPAGAEERFASGMVLGSEHCKPAVLRADDGRTGGEITLTEGKYHQIKRMVEALGSRVMTLSRISFAGIPLPPDLAPGAIRPASEEEISILRKATEEKEK